MERHSVSKIIGAPPGYIGYEKGGYLTEMIRKRPYSIILFDEIEKAHIDVINVLLQILDEGRLTDGLYRVVDFKNTIIILTTNIGSKQLLSEHNDILTREKAVEHELAKIFKPELLNRIDNIVIFNALSKRIISEIIKKELTYLNQKLQKVKNVYLTFDSAVKTKILKEAYSEEFGARPIRRYIQQTIETLLSKMIIKDELKSNSRYLVYVDGDEIKIKNNKIVN